MSKSIHITFVIMLLLTTFKLINVLQHLPIIPPDPFGYSWSEPIPTDQIENLIGINTSVVYIKSVPTPHPLMQHDTHYLASLDDDNMLSMIISTTTVDSERKCVAFKNLLAEDVGRTYPIAPLHHQKPYTIWKNIVGVDIIIRCMKQGNTFVVGIGYKYIERF